MLPLGILLCIRLPIRCVVLLAVGCKVLLAVCSVLLLALCILLISSGVVVLAVLRIVCCMLCGCRFVRRLLLWGVAVLPSVRSMLCCRRLVRCRLLRSIHVLAHVRCIVGWVVRVCCSVRGACCFVRGAVGACRHTVMAMHVLALCACRCRVVQRVLAVCCCIMRVRVLAVCCCIVRVRVLAVCCCIVRVRVLALCCCIVRVRVLALCCVVLCCVVLRSVRVVIQHLCVLLPAKHRSRVKRQPCGSVVVLRLQRGKGRRKAVLWGCHALRCIEAVNTMPASRSTNQSRHGRAAGGCWISGARAKLSAAGQRKHAQAGRPARV